MSYRSHNEMYWGVTLQNFFKTVHNIKFWKLDRYNTNKPADFCQTAVVMNSSMKTSSTELKMPKFWNALRTCKEYGKEIASANGSKPETSF